MLERYFWRIVWLRFAWYIICVFLVLLLTICKMSAIMSILSRYFTKFPPHPGIWKSILSIYLDCDYVPQAIDKKRWDLPVLHMEPSSAALLVLLFFFFLSIFSFISCSSGISLRPRIGWCDVFLYEDAPTSHRCRRRYISVWVDNLMLLKNFFEVKRLKVSACIDDCTFVDEEILIFSCCYAFGADSIIMAFTPEFFPLCSNGFNFLFFWTIR